MGRPREFDVDKALDTLLRVFWRKGYEGASYSDLTAATGLERPALYSAFGNKEALFRKVLARYYAQYLDFIPQALERPTAREAVEGVLYGAIDLYTQSPEHPGCLSLNGLLAGSDDAEPVRQALIEARAETETQLKERFERAKVAGDLPETADPTALAAFVQAVLHGLAVQAKAGISVETLRAVAVQALSALPVRKVPAHDPRRNFGPQYLLSRAEIRKVQANI